MDNEIYTLDFAEPVLEFEGPVIEASLSNATYKGEAGHTPIKGVDYFTPSDINEIVRRLSPEAADIPTKVSDLENDLGYITGFEEEDPVFAASPAADITSAKINEWDAKSDFSGSYNDLTDKPEIPGIPTDISAFNNDAGYLTSFTETDPTVPNWAKQPNKPTYTANEVGAIPVGTSIPSKTSDLINDVGYITTEIDPTVPSWAKAAQKPTYTAQEVGATTTADVNALIATAIGNINSFDTEIVQELPSSGIKEHTIYFVAGTGLSSNIYDEYMYINGNWETIGSTAIDLSGLSTATNLVNGIAEGSLRGINTTSEASSSNRLGKNAMAIGQGTSATGQNSFAQGQNTGASGIASHAEGSMTSATSAYSHAEGQGSRAQATGAHAEGSYAYANASYSHAEGKDTITYGNYSHAEGLGTAANGTSQHVFGEYNIEDGNRYSTSNQRTTYVEIVGNGTYSQSSNARTLDWSGNEWLAGKLTLGAVGVNSMDAATMGQLPPTLTAGTGISITNDTISSDIEYLTNSDILAIWND